MHKPYDYPLCWLWILSAGKSLNKVGIWNEISPFLCYHKSIGLWYMERGFFMSRKNPAKNINIGLLAHVDAGKTTLSEALLYATGQIRALGRVDHQDAFLDTDAQERARGITIFSKQARLRLQMTNESSHSEQTIGLTILDTPGHVDFSAEPMACRDTRGHSGGSCGTITFRPFCLSTRWICRGRTRKSCSSS